MQKYEMLTIATVKIFENITKFKNHNSNIKSLNKNILLNLGYITQSLIIKAREDYGKQYPEIEENEILDFIFPTSKLSYSYESNFFQNIPNDEEFFDKFSTKTTKFLFDEYPILCDYNYDDNEEEKSTAIFSSIFSDSPKEDIFFPNLTTTKVSGVDLDRTGQLNFNIDKEQDKSDDNIKSESSDDQNADSHSSASLIETDTKSSFFANLFKKLSINDKSKEEKDLKKKRICNEFKTCLPFKVTLKYISDMNEYYIRYMLHHFTIIIEGVMKARHFENKMLIKLFTKFILKVGLTDKKIYDDLLRTYIYQNKESHNPEFEDFLNTFNKILKLGNEQKFLKYSFLFRIICEDLDAEIVDLSHIHKFFNLIQCDLVYDEEMFKVLKKHLINNYYELYPSKDKNKFRVLGVLTVLEEFFIGKTNFK